MKKQYLPTFTGRLAAVCLMAISLSTFAQQGSQGNTTIFSGAQMTVFGAHNFVTGGSGTQPGIINTIRTAPYGVLNFGTDASQTGANDANHVDGYVRKYGTTSFIFPVGDNGQYGPFAAAADGTTGAYFYADPSSAVTSMVGGGGNYPPLPAGAPFATSSKDAGVTTVSSKEYWDIDGTNATRLTLTWDALSDVATLTGSDLGKLGIVGWDGSKWVKIPATVDAASILGGPSAVAAGSITTTATLVPDTYAAYTLASVVNGVPDLTPSIIMPSTTLTAGSSRNFVVKLTEIKNVATSGTMAFNVVAPAGYTLTMSTSASTINVTGAGNLPVSNANWTVIQVSDNQLDVVSKDGVSIAANSFTQLGIQLTRKPTTSASSGNIVVSIYPDAAQTYDSNNANNLYNRTITGPASN